jgi:hypothetical protein
LLPRQTLLPRFFCSSSSFKKAFGPWILFLPLILVLGTWVFVQYVLKKLDQQGFFSSSNKEIASKNTLVAYLENRFQSKKLLILQSGFLFWAQ